MWLEPAEIFCWNHLLMQQAVPSEVHPGKFLKSWFSVRKLTAKRFISAWFDPN